MCPPQDVMCISVIGMWSVRETGVIMCRVEGVRVRGGWMIEDGETGGQVDVIVVPTGFMP